MDRFMLLLSLLTIVQGTSIPPDQLYDNWESVSPTFCREKGRGRLDIPCIKKNIYHTDFICRYQPDSTVLACYCSGAIYEYFEYGQVCTRYSFTVSPPEVQYGNDPLIIPPFNWGDKPDRAYTSDGEPYSVIPVYSTPEQQQRVPRNTNETEESVEKIDEAVSRLSHLMLTGLYQPEPEASAANLLFSPVSLHAVLALLYEGAAANSATANELGNVLGPIRRRQILREIYTSLMADFGDNKAVSFNNDIFLQLRFTAQKEYAKTINKYYQAGFSYFNVSNPAETIESINKIISDNTNGNIDKMVTSVEDVDMFVINTVFMQAAWALPFERSREEMTFTRGDGSTVLVPSMQVESSRVKIYSFKFGQDVDHEEWEQSSSAELYNADLSIITLPYADDSGTVSDLEFRIYLGRWNLARDRHEAAQVLMDQMVQGRGNIFSIHLEQFTASDNTLNIQVPVFSVRSRFRVEDFLKANEVTTIFTENAELTKMVKPSEDSLYVNKISQEILVDVSEKGTSLAAATVVELGLLSSESQEVVLDSPFLYSVWSTTNNLPLLVGLLNDPSQAV